METKANEEAYDHDGNQTTNGQANGDLQNRIVRFQYNPSRTGLLAMGTGGIALEKGLLFRIGTIAGMSEHFAIVAVEDFGILFCGKYDVGIKKLGFFPEDL